MELPISRLVVNQPSALTAGGSLTNGFAPTTTLGCGSWGGNSISENLDYKHLMNVSRIGKVITDKKVPTDAEIWADSNARAPPHWNGGSTGAGKDARNQSFGSRLVTQERRAPRAPQKSRPEAV